MQFQQIPFDVDVNKSLRSFQICTVTVQGKKIIRGFGASSLQSAWYLPTAHHGMGVCACGLAGIDKHGWSYSGDCGCGFDWVHTGSNKVMDSKYPTGVFRFFKSKVDVGKR